MYLMLGFPYALSTDFMLVFSIKLFSVLLDPNLTPFILVCAEISTFLNLKFFFHDTQKKLEFDISSFFVKSGK